MDIRPSLKKEILQYVQSILGNSLIDKFYSTVIKRVYDANSPFFMILVKNCETTFSVHRKIYLLFFPIFLGNPTELLEIDYESGYAKDAKGARELRAGSVKQYGDIILDALNNLDEETKASVLLQLKIEVENNYIMQYPTRDFETVRFRNYGKTDDCRSNKMYFVRCSCSSRGQKYGITQDVLWRT